MRSTTISLSISVLCLIAVLDIGIGVSAKEILPKTEPSGPVKVNKKLIDSPLDDIQWADSKTVFVVSEQGQVYRSDDGGLAWVNQSPKLKSAYSMAQVRSIHISRADPRKVFLLGRNKEHWTTTDMGKSFAIAAEIDITEVKLHPTQSLWLLGASMSAGCSVSPKKDCNKLLWLSKDFGQSWSQVTTYIVQFEWAPAAGATKTPPTPDHNELMNKPYQDPQTTVNDDLIYASVHRVKKGNQKFGAWDKQIDFVQTFDYFKTENLLVAHGNRFLFGEHSYLFVATVNPVRETEVTLHISRDAGPSKSFEIAILPVELTEHSYTILDTSEGAVFLHVNHAPFDTNAPTGHVYISDASGIKYSLSLPFNRRSPDGKCDFEKVEGLEGIYLANFIDETEDDSQKWTDGSTEQYGRTKPRIKTVVTFDKGAIWSYLQPPKTDANGNAVKCVKDCHLHLHGITDMYGPFYSSKTATGMIMSTGSVGAYLSRSVDDINTYLSRDAGLSWFEVAKGSHIYEFGDHGGLLVMAYDEGEVDSILYSWDQGVTWKLLKISDTQMQVENIIIEPEAVSQKFIVYGWEENSGVLVYLDFSELHERECVGVDAADSDNSDYETWTPSDGRLGGKCLLGHKVSYTRRKRTSQCFNPEDHERQVFIENCTCAAEDFECDYGYTRKIDGGPCVVDPDAQPLTTEAQCNESGTYIVTKGYRLVAGDTCIGGDQWRPTVMSCRWGGEHSSKFMWLLIIAGIAGSLYYCSNKIPYLDEMTHRIKKMLGMTEYELVGKPTRIPTAASEEEDDDFDLDGNEADQTAHLIKDRN